MTVSHSELEWEHFSAPVSWKRRRDENEMKKHIKRLLGSNNDIKNENSKINLMRVSDTPHHVPFAYLTSKVTELSPHCNLLLSSARNQLGWRIVSCCEVVLGINGKRSLPAISCLLSRLHTSNVFIYVFQLAEHRRHLSSSLRSLNF